MIHEVQLILTGIAIGILVSAPVGPVNVICIQRTLERGFWGGVAAGLGAVLADGVIALAAASGLKAISGIMTTYKSLIQLIGGVVLMAFGLKLFVSAGAISNKDGASRRLSNRWIIPQTFLLTITNPGAILGMFGIVGGVGSALGGFRSYGEAFSLVVAVMGGSLLWWSGLARVISRIRHRLTKERLKLINQIAGLVLLVFGVLLLGRVALRPLYGFAGLTAGFG